MADFFEKYSCTYCQENVTGIMIKCAQCENFYLCLQCFAAGAEIGPHQNDHAYKFIDSGAETISIIQNGWVGREHIQLLDSIEKYSFGNWEDISKLLKTKKPDEAKEEYIQRFIEGNIGRLTWLEAAKVRSDINEKTHSIHNEPTIEPVKIPVIDVSKEEAALLGYMPQRDDFEREFENSAESLVSSLYINNSDDELEIALKLAHVDMFIRKLRERVRRKRVANDFQLVSLFFASLRKDKSLKRKPKEERDFYDRMRVFTQFHTAHEHEQFLQNLAREQELRLRCTELARYRHNGITKLEECFHFEQIRLKHDDWKEKKSDSSGYVQLLQALALKKREKSLVGCTLPDARSQPKIHPPVHPSAVNNNAMDTCGSSNNSNDDVDEESLNEQQQPESIENSHGYHLLNPSEIKDHQIKDIINSQDNFNDSDDNAHLNDYEKQIINYIENSGWLIIS